MSYCVGRNAYLNVDPPDDPNDKPLRAGESRCDACGTVCYDEDMYDFGDYMLCGECFDLLDGILASFYQMDDEQAHIFFERLKQDFATELGLHKTKKKMVFVCSCCGEAIRENDKYFEIMGEQLCPKCILNHVEEAKKENEESGNS